MLRNATGQPVKGENFFDRDAERAAIWSDLPTEHLLLLAPRRVGKTSLLYRLYEEARANEYEPVFSDVSGLASELAFVERLYAAVAESPDAGGLLGPLKRGRVGQFFKNLKSLKVSEVELVFQDRLPNEWLPLGDALFAGLRDPIKRWLLMVDELPLFVLSLIRQDPTANRARVFLEWLRRHRQGGPGGDNPVRWILAGSIGLDTVTRRYDLGDTVNDLKLFQLGAFEPKTADRFLLTLGETYGLKLSPNVRKELCARAGWLIPYHLQLLFSGLRERCGDLRKAPTRAVVAEVFEDLLSPGHRAYFDFWVQRLTIELGPPQDGFAVAILTACARDTAGVTRSTLELVIGGRSASEVIDKELDWLLDVLVSDGYLVEQGERYTFRSNLLQGFWQRRFPS
jgi:hypothetical protein